MESERKYRFSQVSGDLATFETATRRKLKHLETQKFRFQGTRYFCWIEKQRDIERFSKKRKIF